MYSDIHKHYSRVKNSNECSLHISVPKISKNRFIKTSINGVKMCETYVL